MLKIDHHKNVAPGHVAVPVTVVLGILSHYTCQSVSLTVLYFMISIVGRLSASMRLRYMPLYALSSIRGKCLPITLGLICIRRLSVI